MTTFFFSFSYRTRLIFGLIEINKMFYLLYDIKGQFLNNSPVDFKNTRNNDEFTRLRWKCLHSVP
jgi:hypothetical protein